MSNLDSSFYLEDCTGSTSCKISRDNAVKRDRVEDSAAIIMDMIQQSKNELKTLIKKEMDSVDKNLKDINKKLTDLELDLGKVKTTQTDHEKRLGQVEANLTILKTKTEKSNNMDVDANQISQEWKSYRIADMIRNINDKIWEEKRKLNDFKIINMNPSINSPNDFLLALPPKTKELIASIKVKSVISKTLTATETLPEKKFLVIKCERLPAIASKLFSKEYEEDLKTKNLIVQRCRSHYERSLTRTLENALKVAQPQNPAARGKVEGAIIRFPGGDLYYDSAARKPLPLPIEVNELLKP